jgi:hypothetical protein
MVRMRGIGSVFDVNVRWAADGTADGPLTVGATVTVRPTRGPIQHVRIVSLDPERRLVSQAALPGAEMTFHYEIEPLATGCRIQHRVAMQGPLSAVYGLFMRRSNERKLIGETIRLDEVLRAAT